MPTPAGFGGPASKESCSHSAPRSTPASSGLHGRSPCHRVQTGLTHLGQGSSARISTSAVDAALSSPEGRKAGALSLHRHSTMALAEVLARCPAAERLEESRTLLPKDRWTFAELPLLTGHCARLASAHLRPSLPCLACRLPPRGFDPAHPPCPAGLGDTSPPFKQTLPGKHISPREPQAQGGKVSTATLG